MVYGRSKAVPPPATPFEEFMATASERMTAARLEFVEFLRELPPAAWITVGAVVVLLAASSLNWRGKKEASVEPAATTNAAAAEARAPAKPAVALSPSEPTGGEARRRSLRKAFSKATGLTGFFSGKKKTPAAAVPAPATAAATVSQ